MPPTVEPIIDKFIYPKTKKPGIPGVFKFEWRVLEKPFLQEKCWSKKKCRTQHYAKYAETQADNGINRIVKVEPLFPTDQYFSEHQCCKSNGNQDVGGLQRGDNYISANIQRMASKGMLMYLVSPFQALTM